MRQGSESMVKNENELINSIDTEEEERKKSTTLFKCWMNKLIYFCNNSHLFVMKRTMTSTITRRATSSTSATRSWRSQAAPLEQVKQARRTESHCREVNKSTKQLYSLFSLSLFLSHSTGVDSIRLRNKKSIFGSLLLFLSPSLSPSTS